MSSTIRRNNKNKSNPQTIANPMETSPRSVHGTSGMEWLLSHSTPTIPFALQEAMKAIQQVFDELRPSHMVQPTGKCINR